MADKSCEAMNVRFLINRKTQRIVYAEAGKEFVDFLFSFLSMPIGSVLKLMNESESNRKIGSVSNLYDSMAKLPSEFMSTDKSQLLDPKFMTTYSNKSLMIEGGKYYACSSPETTHSSSGYGSYHSSSTHALDSSMFGSLPREISTVTTHNMSTSNKDICVCGSPINRPLQLRQSTKANQTAGHEESGYVKELATFIITDDLKIRRSSTSAILALLNHLNIKDLTELEERAAIVDRKKALKLLEASLVSTTVLTDVFGAELSMPA